MPKDTPWPADKVERRAVASLVPYARNARTHSPAQVDQIAASVREWGWTTPVLVDEDGGIIAGHGRVMAAQKLGIAEVPVMVARGWTEAQKRAYVLADNKLALNAGWDDELLRVELGDLKLEGFDLNLTGFGTDELSALFAVESLPEVVGEDCEPEVPERAVTASGDVWVLGRHRLLCGDSTNPDHIAKLMAGAEADLCFTSPPYGQQRDYKSGGISDWDALMQGVFSILPVKHEAQVLVNLGMIHRNGEWMPYWDGWIEYMRTAGWRRFGWYVWDKLSAVPGENQGRLATSHEFIFHFNRVAEPVNKTAPCAAAGQVSKGAQRRPDGKVRTREGRGPTVIPDHKVLDSVIRMQSHKGGLGDAGSHPAPFPIDLPGELILAFSDPDDLVFEPFCGSGTQLIAAQKNGRSCYGMELAPEYADVAVKRWQNFTGQTATLEADGRTFVEVESARVQR